jgi:hypothetical protein
MLHITLAALALLLDVAAYAAFPPQTCSGTPPTAAQILGYYAPGESRAVFGNWTAYARARRCTASTGCAPWEQAEARILLRCSGEIQRWSEAFSEGSFYSYLWGSEPGTTNLFMQLGESAQKLAHVRTWRAGHPVSGAVPLVLTDAAHGTCYPDGQASPAYQVSADATCARFALTQTLRDSTSWEEREVVFLGRYED